MELVMAAATDCGTVRKVNEDFFYYSKKKNLVILCDGMGGHNAGATASRIAGETVRDALLHPDLAELIRLGQDIKDRLPVLALRMVIGARLANRRLRMMAEQDRNLRGMGTTLVAMAFSENTVCAAHIGDSRIYSLQENKLQQLTDDHSWVNELLQDHEIREDEVKHFRKKNVLTRALGTHPCVKVDVQWFPLNAPNTFLLCSDGLHNALDSEKIVQALGNDDDALLQKSVQRLIQKAKSVDGSDNITAAVVRARKVTSHHAQWHHEKITVPEEPEPSFTAEDRFIRSKYYGKPSRKI